MRLFRRHEDGQPQAEVRETDLIAYARAHVTSPGAHALLDEVERGRRRRAAEERPAGHAQMVGAIDDLTPSDLILIRSGAILGPGATLVLPSGRTITAGQWAEFGGRVA